MILIVRLVMRYFTIKVKISRSRRDANLTSGLGRHPASQSSYDHKAFPSPKQYPTKSRR